MKMFVSDAINTLFIGVRRDRAARKLLKEYAPYLNYNKYRRIVKSEIRRVDTEIKRPERTSELELNEFWINIMYNALIKSGFQGDPKKCAEQISEIAWGMPELYTLAEGSIEFLEHVKKKGLKTIILSNQDSRLKRFITHIKLNGYFEDIYI